MHSIVFLDRATLAPGVRVRRPAFEHRWTEFERSEPADLPERLAGATIVIDNKVALRRETLQQLSDLKLVAIAATGTDCVDKDWCREHGIVVSNVRGYASHTVPEHVFGLTVAAGTPVRLAPREHLAFQWLPWREAAARCFSPSNAQAILQLPSRQPGREGPA